MNAKQVVGDNESLVATVDWTLNSFKVSSSRLLNAELVLYAMRGFVFVFFLLTRIS